MEYDKSYDEQQDDITLRALEQWEAAQDALHPETIPITRNRVLYDDECSYLEWLPNYDDHRLDWPDRIVR
jgi:hypothetical protein